ncbi:hypothetical protein H0H81_000079 [Sphagnurus paluster]|uniref:GH18 domain-containing protein n=1 Tax=Sphagnurus paluster TaxID=117069 RepID=A0A9P7KLV0_9AGAR|nr:hypothetical protein H0H81_000079 [Sphagnurus paluster]
MAVATDTNRTAFLGAVLGLVKTYNLDGIDFDWEYPNKQGIGCNIISPNDSANFLVFLQALRQQAPNLVISLAVGITPFLDATGTPMTDVSGFAKVVDHIAIMAYDIWGSWSTGGVGPNAPLDDSCAPVKDGSATSAVEAWTAANFPADQIALGVPAYGHSFHVDSTSAYSSAGVLAAYPPFDKALQPLGNDDGNGTITNDQCGNPTGPGGVFDFYAMIDSGFLNMNGDPAPGIDYRWDNCSQTVIAKGNFINAQGLKGYSMWQSQGDYNNILTKALHAAMGIQSDCSTD